MGSAQDLEFTDYQAKYFAWELTKRSPSTQRDFIYITTQTLSQEQLHQLSDEVGPDHSLLVLCTAFRGRTDGLSNLTVKKIPKQGLSRCKWGHIDYSLKVENLPQKPPEAGQQDLGL